MTTRSAEEMIAYALEMDPELLPFAQELLSDLGALGSEVDAIVAAIGALGLDSATVVDLGSGKGAVSIAIARELGLAVHGIELFEPFVNSSHEAAEMAGVADRCLFSHGDIREMAGSIDVADVAVFAALGDVLGPLDVTVGILRQYVRPGGFVVINDCCLREGVDVSFPGFEHYDTLENTRPLLTAFGDELYAEILENELDDSSELRGDGRREESGDGTGVEQEDEGALIVARAQELARRYPEKEPLLREFMDSQVAEYEYLEQSTIDVVWVLRRS